MPAYCIALPTYVDWVVLSFSEFSSRASPSFAEDLTPSPCSFLRLIILNHRKLMTEGSICQTREGDGSFNRNIIERLHGCDKPSS